jgi:hypothetical protein
MAFRFRLYLIFTICTGIACTLHGQEKKCIAVFTEQNPKIDGLQEDLWLNAVPVGDFVQHDPWQGASPSQKTEVRIMYDHKAIYIFARMYDTAPDSILLQLGNRDESPNADWVTFKFDTYNNQLDGYVFAVYASGVQSDSRYNDYSYNAVWESKTHLDESGWTAEIRIPYSALRFPPKEEQDWRMQIKRNLRRKREDIIWSPEVKEAENELVYWGRLTGLKNIEPPLRLSFTPYLSAGIDHYPYDEAGIKDFSGFYGGGMDLKYGINESYTLDMTLLPDFSQVQSDDKVKNLSAFETVYSEQRPFFREAVDLFGKGGLFYSRRIGRTPRGFYRVGSAADSAETVIQNPGSASLVNAFKVSGRGKNGLAVGLFNAFTADTWATLRGPDGARRRVLTEPAADYTILVFDQALKNNSSVYYTNSSFLRSFPNYSSSVSAAGVTLADKSNTWRMRASGGFSSFYFSKNNKDTVSPYENGFKSSLELSRINGRIQYGVSQSFFDNHFNANDVGLTLYNNYLSHYAWLAIIRNTPGKKMKNYRITFSYSNNYNYRPFDMTSNSLNINGYTTLMNYLSFWTGLAVPLSRSKDYYEPRVPGRYFLDDPYYGFYLGFSSDYRKPFALDGNISQYLAAHNRYSHSYSLSPIARISRHFMLNYSIDADFNQNNVGFAAFSPAGDVVFGVRDIETWSQTFSGTYVFVNDLSLSLRARHYWSNGRYSDYPVLHDDGTLSYLVTEVYQNYDFNYTSFNIDLVFSWQFSPGSIFNLVWKYELLHEGDAHPGVYFNYMDEAFSPPARNLLSVKFLYYIDYLMLRKEKL